MSPDHDRSHGGTEIMREQCNWTVFGAAPSWEPSLCDRSLLLPLEAADVNGNEEGQG